MKRPIIHRRESGYRRNPEAILIADEEARERIAALREERACPEEVALRSAIAAFARVVGWPTAKIWLAARAHEGPAIARGSSHARQAADRAFSDLTGPAGRRGPLFGGRE